MKNTVIITNRNYNQLINNNDDFDFNSGLTRFKFEDKNGFIWSFRFFKVKEGLYQTKQRLGHMKEICGFCGSLETIMEHIINC